MVVVTPAARVHAAEAVRVLAATFRDDALMGDVVGGSPADREERLAHLFRTLVRAGLRDGVVDLARAEGDPAVLGVAVWERPARTTAGPWHVLTGLGSYLRAFGLRGLRHGLAVQRAMDASRPREDHWYVAAIGVHASGRGQGIGSALLASRLSTVDARAAAPAYLEASTERSAALYARHGFVPTGRVTAYPSASAPIAMWRAGARDRTLAPQT